MFICGETKRKKAAFGRWWRLTHLGGVQELPQAEGGNHPAHLKGGGGAVEPVRNVVSMMKLSPTFDPPTAETSEAALFGRSAGQRTNVHRLAIGFKGESVSRSDSHRPPPSTKHIITETIPLSLRGPEDTAPAVRHLLGGH